jgi:transcriptional regulator with XRE-family HTH domain
MSIGSRLRKAREKKNLSQLDVYDKTNINNKTLSRYENDGAEPDYKTLKSLAALYGVKISYFFEETDIDMEYDLEELLEDKQLTWKDKVLNEEEKKKAIEILNILLDGKRKDTST